MNHTALVLAGLALALTACSKHADLDNSAANAALSPDANAADSLSDANASADLGNAAGNTL